MSSFVDKAKELADKAKDVAGDAWEKTKDVAGDVKEKAGDLFDHPARFLIGIGQHGLREPERRGSAQLVPRRCRARHASPSCSARSAAASASVISSSCSPPASTCSSACIVTPTR